MSDNNYYFHRKMLAELETHTGHLNSNETHLENLSDMRVELNNNVAGDGSSGLRVFPFGHDDVNGKARALFMDSNHNLKVKDDDVLTQATTTNTKLDTTNSHLEILKDTVVEINNNTIGDASDGVRCFVYGHDSGAGKARALFMDSNHNLKVKDDDVLTQATTTNTKLDTLIDFAGQPNNIGDGSNMQRFMNYAYDSSGGQQRPVACDTTGKLEVSNADVETTLTTIDTAVDLNNSRGDELYMNTHASMISNGSIAAGSFSVVIDMDATGSGYQYRSVTIYGSTTSATGKLHFAGSDASGGTYYINPTSAALQVDNAGSAYHFIMTWENCPFRYVKIYASVVTSGLNLNNVKTKHR